MGGPRGSGECRVGGKAFSAGGVADQDRRGDRAAAVLGEQLRRVSSDQRGHLSSQLELLPGDLRDPSPERFGDPGLRTVTELCEAASELCSDARSLQAAWAQAGFELGVEREQMQAQRVRRPGALSDELVAVVTEPRKPVPAGP